MRFIVAFIIVAFSLSAKAQTIITITQDTVISSTMVFTDDTIIEGVDFPNVTLDGNPKIIAQNCRVLVKNVRIQNMHDWGTIGGDYGCLEWYGIGMTGSLMKRMPDTGFFLDGHPKN